MSDVEDAATDRARHASPGEDEDTRTRRDAGAEAASALAAGMALVHALRRVVLAIGKLVAAEAGVARAGIPLLFVGIVALVALAVSLWACVVALIAWLLVLGTGSPGLALGILVVLHVVLVVGVWWIVRRMLRQVTFPQARAELRVLRRTVLQAPGPAGAATAAAPSRRGGADERGAA